MLVENLTRKSSTTLAIAHPAFLDDEADLYVGVFGANTQSEISSDPDDQGARRHGLHRVSRGTPAPAPPAQGR